VSDRKVIASLVSARVAEAAPETVEAEAAEGTEAAQEG